MKYLILTFIYLIFIQSTYFLVDESTFENIFLIGVISPLAILKQIGVI